MAAAGPRIAASHNGIFCSGSIRAPVTATAMNNEARPEGLASSTPREERDIINASKPKSTIAAEIIATTDGKTFIGSRGGGSIRAFGGE